MHGSRNSPQQASAWLAVVALLSLGVSPVQAAGWEEDLAAQLRWDHDCKAAYYSGVIERLVEGQLVVIAKAHCDDGRTFDAIQRNELEEFEINECTPKEQAC